MTQRSALLFTLCCLPGLSVAADGIAAVYPGLVRDGQLIPAVAGSIGQDLKEVVVPMDQELLKRRNTFAYTAEEYRKYFAAPLRYTVDTTGLDRSLLKPAPKAGVHPRVWFNPEDLPEIRKRQTSPAGKAAMDAIREHLKKLLTGPKATFAEAYQKLAAGDASVDIYAKESGELGYVLAYEAFRCLIDEDADGGKKIAAALATLAPQIAARIDESIVKAKEKFVTDKEKYAKAKAEGRSVVAPLERSNDFNTVGLGQTFQGNYALGYDFAHKWMSEDQRTAVRATIAKATAGMTNIGCEAIPVLRASNHIPWENRLIETVTAIEGEDGYDPTTYQRCVNAQANFLATGIYASGEAFEGWAKCFMFLEHAIVMAKRGNDLVACSTLRASFNNFYPASMNPWGGGFTFCDSLGGSGIKIARNADVAMYHTLFPKDLSGSVIYCNQLEGDPGRIIGGPVNTHHPFAVTDALLCAIYATDMPITNLEDSVQKLGQGRPLSYFSDDTCSMITRSAWDKEALYLNYLTRAVPGGHVYADRSHFNFYGLGRFWSIYQGSRQIKEQYGPVMRSVLMCDNEGPSIMEGRCPAFVDTPLATFTATDLSDSWNYQNSYVIRAPKGTVQAQHPFTRNRFRLHPSALPWMDAPIPLLPNWDSSDKPDSADHADWYKRPIQVQKAFRTAGLVRGAHPYSLIVDDLQRDDQVRGYDWTMVLPADVVLGSAKNTGTAAAPAADIVLEEKSGDRHLLVRVLSATALDAAAPATVGATPVPNPPQKDIQVSKLHIPSQSASPAFKILLFPYRSGQALPTTTWSADRSAVTIAWPDQTDQVSFTPGTDGRTRVSIARKGGASCSMP